MDGAVDADALALANAAPGRCDGGRGGGPGRTGWPCMPSPSRRPRPRGTRDQEPRAGRCQRKVQARYDLAVDAIKTYYTGVSEDFLLREDKFKDLRNRLLKSAADFYGKLGALLGKEKDFVSRRALVASNFELADLTDKVGRKEDVLAAHRAVLAAREALAAEPGTDAATKAEVGRSLTAIAGLLTSTEQTDEALATFRRAESLLAGLAESEPSARAALAACRIELGFLLYLTGKSAEAMAVYKMALADQEALAAAHDASNDVRHGLAHTHRGIGVLLMNMDKLVDSETELRAAMAIYQKLADDNPDVIEFRSSLAYSHYLVAAVLMKTHRPAVAEYRAALAIQQEVVADNPAVTSFRRFLAMSHLDVATALQFAGESSAAEAELRTARETLQKLADDNPDVTTFRMYLAQSYDSLSSLLSEEGKSAEAEVAARTAVAILRMVVDDSPDVGTYRFNLALSHNGHGWLLSQTGRPSEAEPVYREALAILQKVADEDPKSPESSTERSQYRQQSLDGTPPARPPGRGPRAVRASPHHYGGPGPRGPRGDEKPRRPGRVLPQPQPDPTCPGRPRRRRGRRPSGGGAVRRPAAAVGRANVLVRVCPRRAGRPGRSRWLGRGGRRGNVRGRDGRGPAPQGRRRGLPQPRRLPHRGRPRPAPRPARLPAADHGPGHAGRAVRRPPPRPGGRLGDLRSGPRRRLFGYPETRA